MKNHNCPAGPQFSQWLFSNRGLYSSGSIRLSGWGVMADNGISTHGDKSEEGPAVHGNPEQTLLNECNSKTKSVATNRN